MQDDEQVSRRRLQVTPGRLAVYVVVQPLVLILVFAVSPDAGRGFAPDFIRGAALTVVSMLVSGLLVLLIFGYLERRAGRQ